MRKFLFACFFSVMSAFCLLSCGLHDALSNLNDSISESTMVEALQQALVLGSKTAASNLGDSSCTSSSAAAMGCATGYLGNKLVEIAVPDTVKNVLEKINSFTASYNALPSGVTTALNAYLGSSVSSLSNLSSSAVDQIKTALNRGAEQAAPASIDVFKNAIFSMSFSDAKEVLTGDSVAATSYLEGKTFSGLQNVFGPLIKEPLDKLNPNQYWSSIASNYNSFASTYSNAMSASSVTSALNAYNTLNTNNKVSFPALPFGNNLTTDLSGYLTDYATGKALNGLFLMVGKQETSLRADPWGTVNSLTSYLTDGIGDLLGDVFSKAKENLL